MTHQLTGLSAVRESLDLIDHQHRQGDLTDAGFDVLHAAAVAKAKAIARPEVPTLAEVGEKISCWRFLLSTGNPVDSSDMQRRLREALEYLHHHTQRLQALEQELQAAGECDTTVVTVDRLETAGAVWEEGNLVLKTETRRIFFMSFSEGRPTMWAIRGERDGFAYLHTITDTDGEYIEHWQVSRFLQVMTGDPTAKPEELVRTGQAVGEQGG